MTEPVAYLNKYLDKSTNITRYKPENRRLLSSDPLYTAEKLHPRVKMTKKQYNRLMWDKENTDLSTCLEYFINSDGNNDFGLPSENLRGDLTQENIAQAWLNPEETIEIVTTMKWFVRSKEKYEADVVQGLPESGYLYLTDGGDYSIEYCEMTTFKDEATQFDTKEEAEKWTNPLTEAVQLPVEGE
ncbi:hypothetical protein RQW99_09090 [Leuconostoc falkenbergense]|uniref:hypothetical protein n=1 Tax=Leuconostoc falkenbergense TaxID=2766470 RepID=UPI002A8372A0|nr:hypothetical protein [Leuconostoc falkenbergense]MDY5164683.1 hypothetical protein [Leuconostoc falkenbergense]